MSIPDDEAIFERQEPVLLMKKLVHNFAGQSDMNPGLISFKKLGGRIYFFEFTVRKFGNWKQIAENLAKDQQLSKYVYKT